MIFEIDIPPEVGQAIRHLPPDIKKSVKEALRALSEEPNLGIPLRKELAGFWRYRVRRYRIVYSIDRASQLLRIYAVGHRKGLY
ncbi:MAG: type II toxin-antitoxin system RelE/ParE family toxin [Deltaproteobacteria bacterium]|nr:type II toxin-antitoxin system RelE/ParE family toxin [Deltaproteobacteria bacterium]